MNQIDLEGLIIQSVAQRLSVHITMMDLLLGVAGRIAKQNPLFTVTVCFNGTTKSTTIYAKNTLEMRGSIGVTATH